MRILWGEEGSNIYGTMRGGREGQCETNEVGMQYGKVMMKRECKKERLWWARTINFDEMG
jgi:hypothetical protein